VNTNMSLPDAAHLRETTAPYLNGLVHVTPITSREGQVLGNNGDTLMHSVFLSLLESWGVKLTSDPTRADAIVVPPNGALLEKYSYPGILAERLLGHENLPVVIFPSSALFTSQDPSFMFAGRSAPSVWILREQHSLDALVRDWGEQLRSAGVVLVSDHDVVASGHEHVPGILGSPVDERHVLIAARVDAEAPGAGGARRDQAPSLVRRAFHALPYGRLSTAAARRARAAKLRAAADRLVARLPDELRLEVGNASARRFVRVDASANQFCTFEEYASLIRGAEVVVTDRLHVGLPAAVLGKRVIIVEAGYHKLGGVYRRSLAHLPNVSFVPGPSEEGRG